MKLSIIIPVYNEKNTIAQSVAGVLSLTLPHSFEKEVIVVNDGSTDGTKEIVRSIKGIKVINHDVNKGKGSAVRTGIAASTGDYIVTHDGDLENDPNDISRLLDEAVKKNYTAIYGSRRLSGGGLEGGRMSFYLGGAGLSVLANILYGQRITDEPTCYKMFKGDFLRSLPLKSKRFEYCPEVTALTGLKGVKIAEIPISYRPRKIAEGKKIRWRDGFEAAKVLVFYRFNNPFK